MWMLCHAPAGLSCLFGLQLSMLILLALLDYSCRSHALSSPCDESLNTTSTRAEIMRRMFCYYQSHETPNDADHSATIVTIYMDIKAITSVDVRKMEYTTDFLLRQSWVDPRLAWDHDAIFKNYTKTIASPILKESLWLPDLFFRNGKEGRLHTMTNNNYLIRIKPNGEVLYSQKITMRFSCQMDLLRFPMDAQECYMDIGSYGYTLNQLRFQWLSGSNDTPPVSLPKGLQISEFETPKVVETHDCTSQSNTSTGQYSCLNATFILSRQLGSWFVSTYIPNILIIMVSWLNFWVNLDAVPARVTLGLLTLLGIITQASTVSSKLPRVSYIKAIDVWSIACIVFDIGVLIEFAVASNLARREKSSGWQVEVRDAVRQELSRWCTACQQQYYLRGPSASGVYFSNVNGGVGCGSGGHGGWNAELMSYANSAASIALAMKRGQLELCEDMQYLLTTSAGHQHQHQHLQQQTLMHAMDDGKPSGGFIRPGAHAIPLTRTSNIVGLAGAVPIELTSGLEVTPGLGGLLSGVQGADSHGALVHRGSGIATPPITGEQAAKKKPAKISEIDAYSRFLFPACFLLFNCFYWLYYLILFKK